MTDETTPSDPVEDRAVRVLLDAGFLRPYAVLAALREGGIVLSRPVENQHSEERS